MSAAHYPQRNPASGGCSFSGGYCLFSCLRDGDLGFYSERQQWTGARIYRGWGSDRLDNLPYGPVGEAAVRIFVWVFDLVKRIICFWISILISPFVWLEEILSAYQEDRKTTLHKFKKSYAKGKI